MSTLYDQVAYPGVVYPFASPDRLSLFGALFGLEPTLPPESTVIELGCGDGANLLAVAQRFPTAKLYGVDLSEGALATARTRAEGAGLRNVAFVRFDLASGHETPLPPCDYLIAHGLLSWVSPDTRRSVLELAGRLLKPNGVAMLSFLTWPGQHDLEPLRQLMRHHVAKVVAPADRIAQARAIALWHLERTRKLHGDARARLMHDLVLEWHQMPDAVFLHDLLADERHPLTISAMAAEAKAAGLSWLANARMEEPRNELLQEDLRDFVRGVADPVTRQAYLDAFLMTRFRTSLFHRSDRTVRRGASASDFLTFSAVSLLSRRQVADTHTVVAETSVGHIRLSPEASLLLRRLASVRPHAVALADCLDVTDAEALGAAASELWLAGAIELTLAPPTLAPTLSSTPRATPLARHLARSGRLSVPTLWHREVKLNEELVQLVAACDGQTPWPAESLEVAQALFDEGVFVP
jgi:SAM-dependent methyltransferase